MKTENMVTPSLNSGNGEAGMPQNSSHGNYIAQPLPPRRLPKEFDDASIPGGWRELCRRSGAPLRTSDTYERAMAECEVWARKPRVPKPENCLQLSLDWSSHVVAWVIVLLLACGGCSRLVCLACNN